MCAGLSDAKILSAGNQMRFLPADHNSVRIVQGRQRTQVRQFLRQDHVVYLLACAHPHVHVRRAAAGGFGGPQGGDDPSAFIRKYRYSHWLIGLRRPSASLVTRNGKMFHRVGDSGSRGTRADQGGPPHCSYVNNRAKCDPGFTIV